MTQAQHSPRPPPETRGPNRRPGKGRLDGAVTARMRSSPGRAAALWKAVSGMALLWSLAGRAAEAPSAPQKPAALPDGFREQVRFWSRERHWMERPKPPPLTRATLVASIEAARTYMLNHQRAEGNFIYSYNYVRRTIVPGDSPVRQAGAVWGLTMLCRRRPTLATRAAAVRALDFFFRNSRALSCGTVAPVYPPYDKIKTNTVDILCLALMDFIHSQTRYLTGAGRGLYEGWLEKYLDHIEGMELGNGSWGEFYMASSDERAPTSNPFVDGESLLVYCRAARELGRKDLIPKIEESAPKLIRKYLTDAWDELPDSELTKQFSQWGCQAFAEYVEAGWKDSDLVGDAALALAWWLIHEHKVAELRANMSYCVEGLIAAYRVARIRDDRESMTALRKYIDFMLTRAITYQIGGPLQAWNPYFKGVKPDAASFGGIVWVPDGHVIRIDNIQHQLHAELMALDLFYPDTQSPPPDKKGTTDNPQ
ncbi:MAG: hypothetical protein GXP31_04595 [Kiritimatiellaeota bacterium]|nr:hypothetical protein [Kiritimatiellota bacterium]